jgi:hypothetical protein
MTLHNTIIPPGIASGEAFGLPVIACHWPRPSPALIRRAEAIYDLGPDALAYLFAELIEGENPKERIEVYASLTPYVAFTLAPVEGHA